MSRSEQKVRGGGRGGAGRGRGRGGGFNGRSNGPHHHRFNQSKFDNSLVRPFAEYEPVVQRGGFVTFSHSYLNQGSPSGRRSFKGFSKPLEQGETTKITTRI